MSQPPRTEPRGLVSPGAPGGRTSWEVTLAALPTLSFVLDRDNVIVDFNAGEESDLYVTPAAFLGRGVAEVLPPEVSAAVATAVAAVRATKGSQVIDYALLMGGVERHYRSTLVALEEDHVAALVLEVSDEKRAAAEARRRAEQQAMIARLGRAALTDADLPLLFDQAMKDTAAVLEVELVKLLALTPDATALTLRAGLGWKDGLVGSAAVGVDVASQAGYTLSVMGPVVVADLRLEHRFQPPPLLVDHQVVSGMSVVVPGRERPYGVLGVHSRRPRHFTGDEASFLQTVAEILGAAVDHHRAAEAFRAHERRFRVLIENAPDGIVLFGADSSVVEVSAAACRLLGYRPEELAGMAMFDLVHPDDHERVGREIEALRLGPGAQTRIEGRVLHNDGSYRVMEGFLTNLLDEPTVRAVVNNFRDVTESRAAEQALRTSEERFREVLQTVDDVVWSSALQGETTYYVNQAFERVFGRPIAALKAQPSLWRDVVPAEYQPAVATARAQMRAHGRFAAEWPIQRPNGTLRWLSLRAAVVPVESGAPVRLAGVATDITERKRLEAQFLQAQKMESIGRLAGGIAHDFNNLLTVVLGQVELARLHDLPAGAAECLGQVQDAAQRAASLTQQLLGFARKQVIAPRPLQLDQFLGDTERMLRRLIGEDIELRITCPPDLWPLHVDPAQLQQVLLDLAVNARDAMPRGGELSITTANVVLGEADLSLAAAAQPGDYVMLAVSDSGEGMSDEARAHLFEPFFTTKEPGRGTGLGLATVYGIAHQNRGHIEVESTAGQGTTIRIYLPRSTGSGAEPREPEAAAPSAAAAEPSPRFAQCILVVEDDDGVRRITAECLGLAGYQVLTAADGVEALDVIRSHEGRLDLVVSDLIMPRMGGRELAERLAEDRPGLRVLFVSGYPRETIASQGVLAPDVELLQKPFDFRALTQRVRALLERKR